MTSLIYDNRFFGLLLSLLGRMTLKAGRWKVVGMPPDLGKYVVIAAPHTSNWDFPVFMSVVGLCKLKVRFLGKHGLFKPPFGWLFKWLGGIPVNRGGGGAAALVDEAINLFKHNQSLILALAPEGTRSEVTKWKTGFYRIAEGAGVPIVLAYLDAPRKELGFGMVFYPTGNMEEDIASIRTFYASKTGIRPSPV